MRSTRAWGIAGSLALLSVGLAQPAVALARPFDVHVAWIRGQHDGDAPEYDRFLHCLIEHSNFADYFDGGATVSYSGISIVAPPSGAITDGATQAAWLSAEVAAGRLPAPRGGGVTSVILTIGDDPTAGTCAHFRNAFSVAGVSPVGTALVSTSCWAGATNSVRNETQLGQHEIAESIEAFLGFNGCGGDGSCEGSVHCAGACSNFLGLSCTGAGAPATTDTYCGGVSVHGWVVQRLGRAHRTGGCNMDSCETCDFVPSGSAADMCAGYATCQACTPVYDCGWCGASGTCMLGVAPNPACRGGWSEEPTSCPTCGDHACNGGETCASCAADCGACPVDASTIPDAWTPPDTDRPDIGAVSRPDASEADARMQTFDAGASRPSLAAGCCSVAGRRSPSSAGIGAAVIALLVALRARRGH